MGQCLTNIATPIQPVIFRTLNRTVKYQVNYPVHKPRTQSARYQRTNKELCQTQDVACCICGRNRASGAATVTVCSFQAGDSWT